MGEMLFVRAAHAKEAWATNSATMSQTLTPAPTTPTAPSTPYKITAFGDSCDDITQIKTTESSNTTAKSLTTDNCAEKTDAKASPPPQSDTEPETQQDDVVRSQSRAEISQEPVARQAPSPLLQLPLEVRLQIYRWVLLLGTIDRKPEAGSSSSQNDATSSVSVSSTLFHCMPPYFFDSPQHFGPGDGIMFMSMFASNAHQRPLFFRKVIMPAEGDKESKDTKSKDDGIQLLPAYRPVGRALPLGLMSSCRQVYQEARTIAFKTSEFVFVRLFSSGLSTAHAFVVLGSQTYPGTVGGDIPRLQLWQRDNLRHVRLELDVSVADMGWTGPERDPKYLLTTDDNNNNNNNSQEVTKEGPKIIDGPKWLAFCEALAKGLHGMRVLLNITEERHHGMSEDEDHNCCDDAKDEYTAEEYAAASRSIVVQGFARLAALRQLEIELVWVLRGRFRSRAANMLAADIRNNRMWCAAVETAVNEARQKRLETDTPASPTLRPVSTKVVCVERIYDEEKKKEGLQ